MVRDNLEVLDRHSSPDKGSNDQVIAPLGRYFTRYLVYMRLSILTWECELTKSANSVTDEAR